MKKPYIKIISLIMAIAISLSGVAFVTTGALSSSELSQKISQLESESKRIESQIGLRYMRIEFHG